MRKSIILASFLFASSAFATYYTIDTVDIAEGSCGQESYSDYAFMPKDSCPTSFWTQFACPPSEETSCPNCKTATYVFKCVALCPSGTTTVGDECKPNTCASGEVKDSNGYCKPSDEPPPPSDPMNDYNNDPAGCDAAGGYYFADGSCNGGAEALAKIMSEPTAVIGALLTVGGMAFSGAGVAALPLTAGGSTLAVVAGGYATAAGLGMMGFTANGLMASTSVPASDVTSGENRIKISLTTSGGVGGASSGTNVTKTNTTTGKVEQTLHVPEATKTAMSNSSNVNKTDATLLNPIGLEGTVSTSYDYDKNIATTITHEAGSTSATPITSTKSTTITVSQNPDGTVTTTPTDTTVAPTVSGSDGGSITSPSTPTTSSTGDTGTGTGASTGNGPDYTGVLNDIKKNTGDTAGFLGSLLGMFDNTDSVDTSRATGSDADGHSTFDALGNDAKNSLDGFVFTDPLGLNNLGSASSLPTYGFTILGHYFVIMDQELLNKLPLDLIRGLFLLMSAIAGFIVVFSGV